MKYENSVRCISCLKRPVAWSGHFHKGKKIIIAGFCDKHREKVCPNYKGCQGCYGRRK